MQDDDGIVVNFYENGKAELDRDGVDVSLSIDTAYPVDGMVKITLTASRPLDAALKLRLPAWSADTFTLASDLPHTVENGYAVLRGTWSGKQTLELKLDMRIRETHPISWERDVTYTDMSRQLLPGWHIAYPETVTHQPEDDAYVSLSRGPLTLAADSRTGKDAASVFAFARGEGGEIEASVCEVAEITDGVPCQLRCEFCAPDGSRFSLVDYASAGRDWNTVIAAWLPIA